MNKPPVEFEGVYRDMTNGRQPIFNHWRNAVPLVWLIALRAAWVVSGSINLNAWETRVAGAIGIVILSMALFGHIAAWLCRRSVQKAMSGQR